MSFTVSRNCPNLRESAKPTFMRNVVLVFLFFAVYSSLYAQLDYSVRNELERNVNVLASGLKQDLSVSKDSLVLENDKLFSKIKFFNDSFEKTFYFKPALKKGKIALEELPLGNYTVMFYQVDKIIVFRVNRKSKFNNTIESVSNKPLSDIAIKSDADYKQSVNPSLEMDVAETSDDIILIDDNSQKKNRSRRKNKLDFDYRKKRALAKAKQKQLLLTEEGMYPYDLTNTKRDHVQTREEYRRTHLRPNGKPYD